jgi:hypothetical protein
MLAGMDRRKQVQRWLALRDRKGLTYQVMERVTGIEPATFSLGSLRRAHQVDLP